MEKCFAALLQCVQCWDNFEQPNGQVKPRTSQIHFVQQTDNYFEPLQDWARGPATLVSTHKKKNKTPNHRK